MAEVAQTVVQLRGLPFKRPVALSDQPPDIGAAAAGEYGAQPAAQISRVYKRIGLLPESVDFFNALMEFSKLQRIVFYEGRRDAVILSPEAARIAQALPGAAAPAAGALPAVLALAQALQEQYFQWHERVSGIAWEDRRLAFRALAQGDALQLALSYLKAQQLAVSREEQVQALGRLTAELEKAGSSLPVMLREKLVFPYREGSTFVQWALAAKGWTGVNALFADPPVASAQILHPERYYSRRNAPLQIVPFGLFRQMKEDAVVEQTLGEYLAQVLLASSHPRREAARIASEWRGDHLFGYPDGEHFITAWISAWSDEKSAQSFLSAFKTVLERRHRLRFDASAPPRDGWRAEWRTGRTVVIQARGALALFLDGIPSARAAEACEAAWKDLEIRSESPLLPFETAQRRAHGSLTSR